MERNRPVQKVLLVLTALLLSIIPQATLAHTAATPALYLMQRGYVPEHTPTYAQITAQACRITLDHTHMLALRNLIHPVMEGAALPGGDDGHSRSLPVMVLSQGDDKPDWVAYRSRTRRNEIIWETVGTPAHRVGISNETHLYEETDRIFSDLTLPRRASAMCGLIKWHLQHREGLFQTD